MPDSYGGTFGGYVAITGIVGTGITSTQKTNINGNLDKLAALFPDPATAIAEGKSGPTSPLLDFNLIPPEVGRRIRAEIAEMKALITAVV